MTFYHEMPEKSRKFYNPKISKKSPLRGKAPEGKCRYRGIIQNTNSRLQGYESGAETNVSANEGTGVAQIQRENARRSNVTVIRDRKSVV